MIMMTMIMMHILALPYPESCTEMTYDGDMTRVWLANAVMARTVRQSVQHVHVEPTSDHRCRRTSAAQHIYHCRDGGSNGTCYTFLERLQRVRLPLSSFNDEAHSPWTYSKAESMCTGLSANIDSFPEDVFGTGHCPGTDAPHVNDDLLITTTSRHEYSMSVMVIVYDAASRGSARRRTGDIGAEHRGSACGVQYQHACRRKNTYHRGVERKVYGVDDDAWHGAAVVYLDAITGNMTMTIAPDPLHCLLTPELLYASGSGVCVEMRRSHRVPAR